MRTVVSNGLVLDTSTMSFAGEAAVVIEDGVIVDVPDRTPAPPTPRSMLVGASCCPA